MEPVNVTLKTFQKTVAASSRPVLLEFRAGWCAPCKRQSEALAALAADHPRILWACVDTDAQFALTLRYHIVTLPTVMLFVNGRAVGRLVGPREADELEAFLRASLPASQL
ncbi:MAG: thioredoxin family protein [Clostridia bacterium]|nr:thioredoxin family protein [Clostridia bacterium]